MTVSKNDVFAEIGVDSRPDSAGGADPHSATEIFAGDLAVLPDPGRRPTRHRRPSLTMLSPRDPGCHVAADHAGEHSEDQFGYRCGFAGYAEHHGYRGGPAGRVRLAQLSGRITKRVQRPAIAPETLGPTVGDGEDPITADALYPRWADFFRPDECDHHRHLDLVAGFGVRATAQRHGLSQPNPVSVDRMGDPGGFRRRGRCSGSSADPDHRRRFSSDDRSGDQPVRSAPAPDCLRAQQLWPSQRATPVQGHGPRLQLAAWKYAELPHAMGCQGWFNARVSSCGRAR